MNDALIIAAAIFGLNIGFVLGAWWTHRYTHADLHEDDYADTDRPKAVGLPGAMDMQPGGVGNGPRDTDG